MSNTTNAVDKLMADATGHGIEEFGGPADRVVFLTLDGEPVVIYDPEPLMQALEKELNGCLESLPETTVEGPMIPGAGVVRFKRQPEDLNAVAFLLGEARRYLGLMVNVAAAFGDDALEPGKWPSLSYLGATENRSVFEELLKDYQEALDHAYAQEEAA